MVMPPTSTYRLQISKGFTLPDAAAVEATGTPARSGVHERIMVAVIRRDGYATYIVVVRSNADHSSPFADEQTFEQAIRSLRGRPVE